MATNGPASPTGQVSFLDTTNSNYSLGTGNLGPTGSSGISFRNSFSLQLPFQILGVPGAGPVATGDFNGDGIPDILLLSPDSKTYSVLIGHGDGTFDVRTFSTSSNGASGVGGLIVGDFNADGKVDFAIALQSSVTIYLGSGDGTFSVGQNLVTSPVTSLVTADFNGDGRLDLSTLESDSGGNTFQRVYLGLGDGTFSSVFSQTSVAAGTESLLTADFNGDQKPDIVTYGANTEVSLLIGNGDGTFRAGGLLPVGTTMNHFVTAATVGDLNGDGKADLVFAINDGPAAVLLGNGDGTFQQLPQDSKLSQQSEAVALADFNGDGIPDLILPDEAGGQTNVFLGKGDGTFIPDTFSPGVAGFISTSLAIADFNGDGQSDIVEVLSDNSGGQTPQDVLDVILSQAPNTAAAYLNNASPVGTGYHYVTANYSGDASNSAGASAQLGILAQQVATVLTLSASPSNGTSTGQTVTLVATLDQYFAQNHEASSTIAFFNGGKNLGAVAVSNGSATFTTSTLAVGTDNLRAVYAGDTNFLGSTSAVTSYVVSTAVAPTLTFSVADHGYGDPPFTVSASSNSPGAITYSVVSGPATISGSVVTLTGAGSVTLLSSQDASGSYTAGNATATLNVAKASQTITFSNQSGAAYVGTSIFLQAGTTSGQPITFTVVSGPATVFSNVLVNMGGSVVYGGILSFSGSGPVVVEADQEGTANYAAASPVRNSFTSTLLTVPVGGSQVFYTFIQVSSPGTSGPVSWLTQGAPDLDFRDPPRFGCTIQYTYAAGEFCDVKVDFTPTLPGLRYGGVSLTSNTGAAMGSTYVYGQGVGPQVNYLPGTKSTLVIGLTQPVGLAFDGSGNLFIADARGGVVREATASSNYTTLKTVGSGFSSPVGVAVDGIGNVFVADDVSNTVSEVLAAGDYITTNVIAGGFSYASDVAVDGIGNVFVSDRDNSVVKEFLVSGGYTTSRALGVGGLSFPIGLGFDGNQNLFVANYGNSTVSELTAASNYGSIQTVGPRLSFPVALAVNSNGDLFVTNQSDDSITEIFNAGGYKISRSVASAIGSPSGVALDGSGNLYVSENASRSVLKYDYSDPPSLSFAPTLAGATSTDSPQTVSLTNNGNASLVVSVPTSGSNPVITPGFTIGSTSTCPLLNSVSNSGSLASDAFCTEVLSFTPVAAGPNPGNLIVTDNNLNTVAATQTIQLNGVGVATSPTIAFSVPNHTYGDPPFSVTATSNSPATITYAVVSGPATLLGSTLTLTGAGTVTLQANQVASGAYSAGSQSTAFTVSKEPQTINFVQPGSPVNFGGGVITLSATAGSGLPVSFTVLSGPANVTGNSLTITAAGKVVIAADQGGNSNYNAAPEVTRSIVVIGRFVNVNLTAAPNPVFLQNPLTLAAALSATGGVLTGTVTFFDGSVALGTVGVGASTATLVTSSLTLGSHAITASYGGDSIFAPIVSTPVVVTVQDFTLAATNSNLTIVHGGTATYNLVLSAIGGVGMASTVNFAISGQPDRSEVTFTPQSVPAGSGPTPVTLVIHTPNYPTGPFASSRGAMASQISLGMLGLGVLLLPFRRRLRLAAGREKLLSLAVFVALGAAGTLVLTGCGSGWRTQNFTIQVTASSGQLTRTTTLTLSSECRNGQVACPVEN